MDAAGEEGGMTYGEVVDYFNSLQDPPAQERIDCIIPYLISLLPAPFVPAPPDAASADDSEDDHFSFTSSDDYSAAEDARSFPSPPPGDGEEDHISRLADDLLSEIIPRLSTKEAARTMALSTRWRRVWAKTSLLVDDAHLRDADNEVSLVRAISRCVDAHPGPVRAARITHVAFYHHEYALRRLVASLADKNVEDLILFNRPWPLNMPLPDDIFRCAYLRRLYLGAWMFPEVAAAALVNLRELGLFHCIIPDRDFDALLSLCSKLEVLSLAMSYNCPSRLRIKSPSLRAAVEWMSSLDEIVVDGAPCLERLLLHHAIPVAERTPIKIVSAPRLEVLGILDLQLHELQIGGTTIRPGMWMFVKSSAKLPSLKILAVKVCLAIEREIKLLMTLLKCFPHLETLHIKSIPPCASPEIANCADVWESLGSCECLKSHLKTVSIQGFHTERYEVLCLKYLILEGEVLETVAFFCEDKVCFAAKDDEAAEIELMFPKNLVQDRWSFQSAIDLSLDDPFFYAVES
ncbi:hypothetical protein OsI_02706 [Oryza sativa Indica Group]|uniref:Uncharacterized protein n=1 Tax=Oryza sativa subsp. indica TaxID=39946 RepID=A2WS68_ORYSI|nr:hypothetical protein OsI_02706 [Oryza sativa Indica Group]